MKTWQKWGLFAAASFVLIKGVLDALTNVWWYQEAFWYRCWFLLSYPAVELSRVLLNWLQIPRIYGVPLEWRESVIIKMIVYGLGVIWWFFLGAGASAARLWWVRWKKKGGHI